MLKGKQLTFILLISVIFITVSTKKGTIFFVRILICTLLFRIELAICERLFRFLLKRFTELEHRFFLSD